MITTILTLDLYTNEYVIVIIVIVMNINIIAQVEPPPQFPNSGIIGKYERTRIRLLLFLCRVGGPPKERKT